MSDNQGSSNATGSGGVDSLTGPKDDSAAVALLKGADFRNYKGQENDDDEPADLHDDDEGIALGAEPESADEPKNEPADDGGETEPEGGDDLRAQIAALQEEIKALKPKPPITAGKAGGGSVTAPAPAANRLERIRAKLASAKEKLGDELVDELGLADIVDAIDEEMQPIRDAQKAAVQQQEATQAKHRNQIHGFFDAAAKADPDLAAKFGKSATGANAKQREWREAVYETARELQIKSTRMVKLGRAEKALTDAEALMQAASEVTGKKFAAPDAADKARARMASPGRGGTTTIAGAAAESSGIKQATGFIRQFLQTKKNEE